VKAILFDKTGTLTEGNLEIQSIIPNKNYTKEEIISIACSLENKSKHPIAKAFNEYLKENKTNLIDVENFKSISGKGLEGNINDKHYYIGKKELFNYNTKLNNEIQNLQTKNGTISKTSIILGDEKNIIGIISLSDKIRNDSANTVNILKNNEIQTIMLTGDNNQIASNVASEIGLDKYYSNLLPEEKVKLVEEMINKYNDVAMVGDGVNDTPSLARANVGIAMGMNGADVAVETGDIILMNDDISKISYVINLAKKTMNIVKENITISLTVKGFLAVLGIAGFISLWEAVLIGDMGLTLIVVGNALRAANYKPETSKIIN
jgi:Cd2+/Zn2+-exporting ATPase